MKKNRMYALRPGEYVLKFLKIMRLGILPMVVGIHWSLSVVQV